jgi:hypothetical protein
MKYRYKNANIRNTDKEYRQETQTENTGENRQGEND